MTRTQIEEKFRNMMLDFNPVGNREKSRKYGYWSIPAEVYKVKVIPGKEYQTWDIKIESYNSGLTYTAQEGIEWVQDLIRDKMEENADRCINHLNWTQQSIRMHERRAIREFGRAKKQLWKNPAYTNYNLQNGKKNNAL